MGNYYHLLPKVARLFLNSKDFSEIHFLGFFKIGIISEIKILSKKLFAKMVIHYALTQSLGFQVYFLDKLKYFWQLSIQ